MFWISLLVIGTVFTVLIWLVSANFDIACLIIGFFFGLIATGVLFATAHIGIKYDYVLDETKKLNSLVLSNEEYSDGTMFLLIGSYESGSEKKYYYMAEEHHGYSIKEQSISNAYINFVSSDYRLEIHRRTIVESTKWGELWGFIPGKVSRDEAYGPTYVFFIPETGAKEVYDVNLENLK